jgi:hypothetical protein
MELRNAGKDQPDNVELRNSGTNRSEFGLNKQNQLNDTAKS